MILAKKITKLSKNKKVIETITSNKSTINKGQVNYFYTLDVMDGREYVASNDSEKITEAEAVKLIKELRGE